MESADSQSPSWQTVIDRGDAKRQNFSSARATPLDSLDLVAQGLKNRLLPQLDVLLFTGNVLFMFSLWRRESIVLF